MDFLLLLGRELSAATEPKDFWWILLQCLREDHLDLPFAALYSAGWNIHETLFESSDQSHALKNWTLEGLVRIPERNSSVPRRFSACENIEEFLPNFPELIKADSPTLLSLAEGSFPQCIADNLRTEDGIVPLETAVFLPIKSTTDTTLGFLILGINFMKRFDDDYQLFVDLLSRQLATSIAVSYFLHSR
jgi:hypothetical protein